MPLKHLGDTEHDKEAGGGEFLSSYFSQSNHTRCIPVVANAFQTPATKTPCLNDTDLRPISLSKGRDAQWLRILLNSSSGDRRALRDLYEARRNCHCKWTRVQCDDDRKTWESKSRLVKKSRSSSRKKNQKCRNCKIGRMRR